MGSLWVVLVVLVVAGVACWMRGAGSVPGPRLTDDLAPAILARAGFAATPHNVAVLRARLGEAFLAEARALGAEVDAPVSPAAGDLVDWPQQVLDEIAAVDPAVASAVAHRCPQALLDAVGSGHGVLGGSVFAPLPVAEVPLAALPAPPALPAPRAAGDRLVPLVPRARALA